MITEKAFNDSAALLGVEPAVIKAVAEVESRGNGFLPSGHPVVLFEPHVFWQELLKRNISPGMIIGASDILYKNWQTGKYGKNSAQPERLKRAIAINKDAALSSASWGKFQIMGYNYGLAGFADVDSFVAAMHIDEDQHLHAFINFVKNKNLVDELQRKDWAGFALGYNGSGYKQNKYDVKLAAAYIKFKGSL
jgi:hypothetical protein